MSQGKTGVLLLAFGGPESLQEIPSFLESLMRRTPPPHVVKEVTERYRSLGGKSPLPEATRQQARNLAAELQRQGYDWPVFAGMQFAEPHIGEVLEQMANEGIRRVVAISLAPFRSQHSTQAYEETVRREVAERNLDLEVAFPPDWNTHPLYIDALVERLEEGLSAFTAEERENLPVIFSAHSVPVHYIEAGDPYVEQLEATIAAIDAKAGPLHHYLAYQSKGATARVPWLGPEVEELMDRLHAEGHRAVLVDPIGFVTDHLETLYDNDTLHREHAEKLGMKFVRCRCLNQLPTFIRMLADLAVRTVEGAFAPKE